MKKVISIGTDRNIFKEGSAVRIRQMEYGKLFDELHIVVFTRFLSFLPIKIQIAPNVWVYGTHSLSKLLHVSQAVKIAGRIIKDAKFPIEEIVITVQDPFEVGLVGKKLKKKFGVALHVQIHTDFLNPHFLKESIANRLRVKIASKVLLEADAVRVVSKRIADSLREVNLKPGVTPAVIPIFVDIKKIESALVSVDLKKKYSQFNFIILMVSRLSKEKDIPFAIKVFKSLLDGPGHKAGLVIVGSGPEEKKIKNLVKRLKIQDSVVFEGWQDNLATYFKTANMLLLTSKYEGYGMTLVEAIAAHCPVVSTDVGIARELLAGDDADSFVCPVGHHDCLVNMITRVIGDNGLRERSVHEAYSRLERVVVSSKSEYLKKYLKDIESTEKSAGLEKI